MGCGASTAPAPDEAEQPSKTPPQQQQPAEQSKALAKAAAANFSSYRPAGNVAKDTHEQKVSDLFAQLDADGSGNLDASELLAVLTKLQINELTEADCSDMVRDFDVSGDGKIQLSEFAAMVRLQENSQQTEAHLELHFDVNKTVRDITKCT